MKYLIIPFLGILFFGVQTTFSQNNINATSGRTFNIQSIILNEERTCLINLPDSYNNSTEIEKKYPIIILLDGNTHFKTRTIKTRRIIIKHFKILYKDTIYVCYSH